MSEVVCFAELKLTAPERLETSFNFSTEICGTFATVAPIDPLFGASLQHSAARNATLELPGCLTQAVDLVGKELLRPC